jgi:ubiquitin-activating enzyme E1
MKTRKIAGNIIPAIASTTALTTGCVMLELFKLALGLDNIEDYSSWNLNLGVNQYTSFEPTPCDKQKFAGKMFSVWSYIDVEDQIVGDFLEWFEETYGMEIEELTQNELTLLNTCLWDDDDIDRIKEMMLSEAVADAKKVDVSVIKQNTYILLGVTGDDEDEDEDEEEEDDEEAGFMPQIRVKVK